ncbi:hypothetical protein P692DRAFT_201803091 [Suillus brevipes Sb2]|nr:hypothetical protein P692DRAFT_201803091 [Suillus brevipes Sb2]
MEKALRPLPCPVVAPFSIPLGLRQARGSKSSDPVIHQPDAVGIDDGYRPYVVFFCLSWFQKKKKPQPQPVVYDDEFDGDDDEEEENVPVPVAVPPRVPEEVELQTFADQAQPEAGPSRPAVTDHLEA